MAVVVISVPTAGVSEGGVLTDAFLRKMAQLHEDHPDISFINPMVQGYALLPYLKDSTATWEVWGKFCERLIAVADELWVFQFPGWKESKGVKAEIAIAARLGKKVYHFSPELHDRTTSSASPATVEVP